MPRQTHNVAALSPEYALLGFLLNQPAHGYELHQRLTTDLGQVWRVSLSQTYNILNRLQANGLIAGRLQEQTKLPSRCRYHLTAAGRRHFEEWFHTAAGCSARAIRVEFLTRLYFARQMGTAAMRRVYEAQTAALQACLARLQMMLDETPADQVFNRLGVELRIRQLATTLEWLRECESRLELNP